MTSVNSTTAGPAVKAQPKGEQVSESDQDAIHDELQQRVSVDWQGRGTDPSAHRRGFY
jgi:hypothetical protein